MYWSGQVIHESSALTQLFPQFASTVGPLVRITEELCD
jgi:hypothetical protein